MAKQFQIYFLPSDAVRLVEVLRQQVSAHMLPFRLDGPTPVEMNSPIKRVTSVDRIECFLTPSLSSVMKIRHVQQQGYWIIQSLYSDVIEFSDCHFDGKILRRGRLFYDPGFYDENGLWQEKSPAFISWAEKIFKITKSLLKRSASLDAYIGDDAARWNASGGVLFSGESMHKQKRKTGS